MKFLLAISGGVDSVVLLHMLSKNHENELMVAHVDHGIRQDSSADARFVEALAKSYGLEFVSKRFELGENASEEQAREARYGFLKQMAEESQATIVTAHHADDMAGSVAINLIRGTGWRGLGVLSRSCTQRPLLNMRKADIFQYALTHRLEWVEDSTNQSQKILRNRLRPALNNLPAETIDSLTELRNKQLELRREIDAEADDLIVNFGGKRQPYSMIENAIALELLRQYINKQTGVTLARPDINRLLISIKTAKNNTTLELSDGIKVRFSTREFIVAGS